MNINMNGRNKFGKFTYFTDGVVSTVKSLQKDSRSKHMDKLNKSAILKVGQANKKLQADRLAKRVRDGFHTIDVIYLRSLEVGVTRFWKVKMDYVHTG